MISLEQLTTFDNIEVPIRQLIINLILTAVLAYFLKVFYSKFGQSLSNRQRLASNFVIIAITTALVITIVKSSLALSLGLVGALSIVRFRTAIKEPEELSFLFLSIALGLGLGANQRLVTIIAFVVILVILYIQRFFNKSHEINDNLFLNIDFDKEIDIDDVVEILQKFTKKIDLKKVFSHKNNLGLACNIELLSHEDLNKLMKSLRKKYPKASITFTDTSGLMG